VNDEMDSGLLTQNSAEDYGSLFGLEMPYGPLDMTPPDVSAPVPIRDDVVLNFLDSMAPQGIAKPGEAIFDIGVGGHESAPGQTRDFLRRAYGNSKL
jgi:hypothetical protein